MSTGILSCVSIRLIELVAQFLTTDERVATSALLATISSRGFGARSGAHSHASAQAGAGTSREDQKVSETE